MPKRITFLILIILLVLIAGLLVFYFFFSPVDDEGNRKPLTDFFPFGKSEEPGEFERQDGENGTDELGMEDDDEIQVPAPLLQQLSSAPVAGAAVLTTDDKTSVRYVERGTGHIYEVALEDFQKTRLTNTTVPAIREAIWGGDGEELIMRYLNVNEVIKSFAGQIGESDGTGDTANSLKGAFIDDDIQFVTASPASERIFYLFQFDTNAIGITSRFDGTERVEVFNSSLTEWLPQWPEANTIALTTKAASIADGYLYFLNIRSGSLDKVMGNIPGLTTNTSPNLNFILYSQSTNNLFRTNLYHRGDNVQYNLPITTLPEKCAWSKTEEDTIYCGVPKSIGSGAYPDVWYQGIVSFSDTIWKVDASTRATEQVIDPLSVARVDMDVINPTLSDNGKFLIFTNKKDSTLWSLKLN